jgi:hypothetical protein
MGNGQQKKQINVSTSKKFPIFGPINGFAAHHI